MAIQKHYHIFANSTPSYVTKSKTAIGPINDLKITNTGYSFVYPTEKLVKLLDLELMPNLLMN